jgi:3-oxoacyl-[acyl-carrier-protein] synthase-1
MTPALAVLATGLVCGVGLTAAESCAAIRCGVNNFAETRFIGAGGEWLIGSAATLEKPWRGLPKLARMAAAALQDCFGQLPEVAAERVPVLLCVAEPERPGRLPGLEGILPEIEAVLGLRLHAHSRVLGQGRVGGAVALRTARRLLVEGRHKYVIVAGVDGFLAGPMLAAYDAENRLLRPDNSNGFIPGEAAGAVLLASWEEGMAAPLLLRGLGFAREPAFYGSGKPLRGDGLVAAVRGALAEAGIALHDCDHRIADVSGEQYRFKEAALAVTRILRARKVMFSIWHPADCIGEVGAAALPAMLAVLHAGAAKDYLPGPVFLGHLGNDDDLRAAFVTQATAAQSLALEAKAEAVFSLKRRSAA